MRKIIKLTEVDLQRMVKKIIKESEERDYDYIDDLLGNYGLHPNWGWYEEFENSNYYDPNMSDDEYAESIYDFISDEQEYLGVEIGLSDDLKSNFRSWEYDHDNQEDAESLFQILKSRHPNVEPELIRKMAYHWVGYDEE